MWISTRAFKLQTLQTASEVLVIARAIFILTKKNIFLTLL